MGLPETPERDPARRSALERLREDPVSRRKFVAATGMGGALAVFLAACGSDDSTTGTTMTGATDTDMSSGADTSGTAQFGEGDLGIVNYALTLEYLEAAFYEEVAGMGVFKGAELALLKEFGANESAHVKALEQTANKLGKAAPKPKTEFPLADDADSIATLAAKVENVGAAAYLGQAPLIMSDEVLAAALSIHTVEARHAAVLNLLVGDPITPDGAFAVPMSAEEVLPEVQDFIVS